MYTYIAETFCGICTVFSASCGTMSGAPCISLMFTNTAMLLHKVRCVGLFVVYDANTVVGCDV